MIPLLLLTLLITPHPSSSTKNQASPVYEVVNEQARIDDRIRISSNPGLPYGNPLAGNQNARLHFNNQQAMFNAERMRQLAAQLQRQARGPKLMDSYMQAYHESQDNHQLALEQQQSSIQKERVEYLKPNLQRETKDRDEYVRNTPRKIENAQSTYGLKTRSEPRKSQRTEPIRESARKTQRTEAREPSRRTRPELMRITKTDSKDVRYRNHRSYGSADYYQQHLEPQRYKTVYLYPAPTYDQGVTIRPNGNLGVAQETESKLLTEAIPSDIKYVYPKQYHDIQEYKSGQEIQANSLLKNQESPEYSLPDTNNTPFDYYFHLKNQPQSLPQSYDQYRYAQLANTYAGRYTTVSPTTDYKPITEDVDDIEDPNAKNPQAFTPLPTPLPTAPTKPVPLKIVPSLPTVPTNYNAQELNHVYTFDEGAQQEEKPVAQAVHYYQPYYEEDKEEKKYLRPNSEGTGVQHLTEDGSITAYGNDNLHYASNYQFGYRIHDDAAGNYFGHSEAKEGDSTDGHYHVLLPDGRMQSVKYHAGPSGFHADISYEHLH